MIVSDVVGFLLAIVSYVVDPVAFVGGVFIGYLFHRDMAKLAWMLLFFVMPGLGSLLPANPLHGALFCAAAQFVCVCLLAAGSYHVLEWLTTRRSRIASLP